MKKLGIAGLSLSALTLVAALGASPVKRVNAAAETNIEEGIYITQIDGWTSGNRHSGINFTLNQTSVTVTDNSYLVLDYANYSNCKNIISFYLNGFDTSANRLDPKTATPIPEIRLFKGENYVTSYFVSTGTADVSLMNNKNSDYDKIAVRLADFPCARSGSTVSLNSLFFCTRLNSCDADRTLSDINAVVKGIYLVENSQTSETLSLAGATKVYTPAANNFVSVSGNNDSTEKYIAWEGKYAVPATYTLSGDEGGTLQITDKVYVGADVAINILPTNEGYVLDTLTVNGVDVTSQVSNKKYVVENVPASGIVAVATFKHGEPCTYSLTTDGNGSLTMKESPIYAGETGHLVIEANRYYTLDSLTVNGVDVTSEVVDGEYEISSMTQTGLTANATFKRVANVVAEHGKVEFNNFVDGEDVVLKAIPDASYEVKNLKVNGQQVALNKYNQCLVKNAVAPLSIEANFVKATEYDIDEASLHSIHNHMLCNNYATFDAVNFRITTLMEHTDNRYVGITTNDIDRTVSNSQNLVFQISNMDSESRIVYIEIDGKAAESSEYYLIDRLGNFITKTGIGASLGKYEYFSNETWTSTGDKEGFSGYVIFPLSRYGAIEEIHNISFRVATTATARPRFNIGSIYVDTSLNAKAGWMDEPKEENLIWKPSNDNWTTYVTPAKGEEDQPTNYTELYGEAKFMEKDEMIYGLKTLDGSESPNYDTFHLTLPQNTIGEDGYVDLAANGIKGIIFDVENHNQEQVQFAFRVAGASASNLSKAEEHPLWTTSSSTTGHYGSFIYESGIVQFRGSKYLPYNENGDFKGSLYIPLDKNGFTKISTDSEGFPNKIQPVMRILFAEPKDCYNGYKVKLSNFRLVTDDSPYIPFQVTLAEMNSTINASVGDMVVTNSANNHLLPGTELKFTVTPTAGYEIDKVTYSANGEEHELTSNEQGVYSLVINSDVVIFTSEKVKSYSITYELDGGTNDENNPTSFEYGGIAPDLNDPTKEGFTFIGWVDQEGNEITEIDTYKAGDLVLTAKWEDKNSGKTGGFFKKLFGCGGSIVGASIIVSITSLAGAALLVSKKRKEQK